MRHYQNNNAFKKLVSISPPSSHSFLACKRARIFDNLLDLSSSLNVGDGALPDCSFPVLGIVGEEAFALDGDEGSLPLLVIACFFNASFSRSLAFLSSGSIGVDGDEGVVSLSGSNLFEV